MVAIIRFNNLCSKLSSQLVLLGRVAKLQNLFLMRLIYTLLINSRLRYGVVICGSAPSTTLVRFSRLQNQVILVTAGVHKRTPCKHLFQ